MTTNQGDMQQSARDLTGTALDWGGDMQAMFDLHGTNGVAFNERLKAWIDAHIGITHASLPNAMAAWAVDQGKGGFSDLGRFKYAHNGADFASGAYLDGVDASLVPDGKELTYSAWLKPDDVLAAAGNHLWNSTSGRTSIIMLGTTGLIRLLLNDSSGTMQVNISSDAPMVNDVWQHLAISVDGTNEHFYLDGVAWPFTITAHNDTAFDLSTAEWSIGANAGGAAPYNGSMQEVLLIDEFLDISVAANLHKLRTPAGNPAYMGADGSLVTGTQPLIYLANKFDTFQNNLGSLDNFTENDTLTDEGTSPSG